MFSVSVNICNICDRCHVDNSRDGDEDEEPYYEESDYDEPNGDEPNGDEPNGDEPNGDEPNGDEPNGDEPNDDFMYRDILSFLIRECHTNGVWGQDFCKILALYKSICRAVRGWLMKPGNRTLTEVFWYFTRRIKLTKVNFAVYKAFDFACFGIHNAAHWSLAYKRPIPGAVIKYFGRKCIVIAAGPATMCLGEVGIDEVYQGHVHANYNLNEYIHHLENMIEVLNAQYNSIVLNGDAPARASTRINTRINTIASPERIYGILSYMMTNGISTDRIITSRLRECAANGVDIIELFKFFIDLAIFRICILREEEPQHDEETLLHRKNAINAPARALYELEQVFFGNFNDMHTNYAIESLNKTIQFLVHIINNLITSAKLSFIAEKMQTICAQINLRRMP